MAEDKQTEVEIKLAHTERVIEDLSDEVTRLNKRVERAEKRLQLLLDKATAEAGEHGVILTDDTPPHY